MNPSIIPTLSYYGSQKAFKLKASNTVDVPSLAPQPLHYMNFKQIQCLLQVSHHNWHKTESISAFLSMFSLLFNGFHGAGDTNNTWNSKIHSPTDSALKENFIDL